MSSKEQKATRVARYHAVLVLLLLYGLFSFTHGTTLPLKWTETSLCLLVVLPVASYITATVKLLRGHYVC